MLRSFEAGMGLPVRAMVRYYANMFTASGMLTQTKENVYDQKESLVAICGIAGVSTAVAMMVSSKFFLPSFMSFAYAACIVLVVLYLIHN